MRIIKKYFIIYFIFSALIFGCSSGISEHGRLSERDYNYLITHPQNGQSKGTILLIHGSGPFNIDGRIPIETGSIYSKISFYKHLAISLNQNGWSVVRYSRPGVRRNFIDFNRYKITDLDIIGQQLNCIWKKLPANSKKVIFAWSEGSLHASLLPLKQAYAVILLGGIATNIKNVIISQAKREGALEEVQKLFNNLDDIPRDKMLGIDRPAGRLTDEFNMRDNWTYYKQFKRLPILILHGDNDLEVPVDEAYIWAKKLPAHKITTWIKQGRGHTLGVNGTINAEYIAENIINWLDSL